MIERAVHDAKAPPGPTPGGGHLATLEVLSRRIGIVANGFAAICCFGLGGIVAHSVFMRYVLNQPQTWADELSGYVMVLMVMLGVAEAFRRNDHIGIDLVTQKLGPRAKYFTDLWSTIGVIIIAVVLLVSSIEMVEFSYSVGLISEGYVEVEMWIPQSAIPMGMSLLIIAAVNRLLQQLVAGPPTTISAR